MYAGECGQNACFGCYRVVAWGWWWCYRVVVWGWWLCDRVVVWWSCFRVVVVVL